MSGLDPEFGIKRYFIVLVPPFLCTQWISLKSVCVLNEDMSCVGPDRFFRNGSRQPGGRPYTRQLANAFSMRLRQQDQIINLAHISQYLRIILQLILYYRTTRPYRDCERMPHKLTTGSIAWMRESELLHHSSILLRIPPLPTQVFFLNCDVWKPGGG